MKRLVGLMILGWMLLGTRPAFARRDMTTPPLPPGADCVHQAFSLSLDAIVPQSDIIAFGHIKAPQEGLFQFQLDEHIVGGEQFSAVDVIEYNPEHYGQQCAQEFSRTNPLFGLVPEQQEIYFMTFTVIEDDNVQLNGVIPLEMDQSIRVNVVQGDPASIRFFDREQIRQEVQRLKPQQSNTNTIMMIGLFVVAVGSGIAAFIGWRRQQTT